jgi:hypothetical protein
VIGLQMLPFSITLTDSAPSGSLVEKTVCQPPGQAYGFRLYCDAIALEPFSLNHEHMRSSTSRQRVIVTAESLRLTISAPTPLASLPKHSRHA